MKNPFAGRQERKKAEEEEIRKKKERLDRLSEDEWSSGGFHIHRKIKPPEVREEIRRLREEIAAYETRESRKKERIQKLPATIARICVVLALCLLVTLVFSTGSREQVETEETASATSTTSTTAATVDLAEEDANAAASPEITAVITSDYAHAKDDITVLGNDEGATLSVTVDRTGATAEDVPLTYDESLLTVTFQNATEADGKTTLTYYVTGKQACETQLQVAESVFNVKKLDSSAGEICYITPTGKKYHFSQGCAGENAITTTCYDVSLAGTEPCRRCAGK